jgi:hypothetical protein
VERRKGYTGSYQIIATLGPNETFYADKNLTLSETYFYRVLALVGHL